MKKTIAIGDVHGLTNWKDIVNAPENKGCRFVFLGDYVDPYSEMRVFDLLHNVFDLIGLKNELGDDCVLLLGNHDMHYLYDGFTYGTRHDGRMVEAYEALLSSYRRYFQFAYQEGKTLYTHAGISNGWWEQAFLPLVDKSAIPMKEVKVGDHTESVMDIASILNNANEEQLKAMFRVGYIRGGDTRYGGIFWADMQETASNPLKGYYQVVGHTMVPAVHTYSTDADTQISFCDCLESGAYHYKPSED